MHFAATDRARVAATVRTPENHKPMSTPTPQQDFTSDVFSETQESSCRTVAGRHTQHTGYTQTLNTV